MAERANRTVIEGVRRMLEDARFARNLWAEVTSTFCYVDNFLPSERFPDDVPAELWHGKQQDISHLRPIGCDVWAKLPERHRDGKLVRQAVKGKLLGYVGRWGWKIWLPEVRKIMESRDVRFEEGLPHRTLPLVANGGNDRIGDSEDDPNSFDQAAEPPTITTAPITDPTIPQPLLSSEILSDNTKSVPSERDQSMDAVGRDNASSDGDDYLTPAETTVDLGPRT